MAPRQKITKEMILEATFRLPGSMVSNMSTPAAWPQNLGVRRNQFSAASKPWMS